MATVPVYDDSIGWLRWNDLIDGQRAADLAARCRVLAAELDDPRSGDKPNGATQRLTELDERLPETAELASALAPVVDQILDGWRTTEIAYRSPGPGHGFQRLHADDLPRLDDGPHRAATAIIALVDVTEENGATAAVPGSHRRPDLQRQSGQLESHPDAVALTGPAGTVFVFTGHLLHGGTTNRSSEPRPVLQISYRAEPRGPGEDGS